MRPLDLISHRVSAVLTRLKPLFTELSKSDCAFVPYPAEMQTSLSLPQRTQEYLRETIDGYTAKGAKGIPGVLYLATRNHGRPIFEHASGLRGIDTLEPMSLDTVFWLASFTKLITSIACMQLVEQGKFRLDDAEQVELLVPELCDVQVLKKAAGGGLELVPKNTRITLRMLLTHTGVENVPHTHSKRPEGG